MGDADDFNTFLKKLNERRTEGRFNREIESESDLDSK
jgi:hypothetical protein